MYLPFYVMSSTIRVRESGRKERGTPAGRAIPASPRLRSAKNAADARLENTSQVRTRNCQRPLPFYDTRRAAILL